MLRATNLQFKRGDSVLFDGLDFVVHPGQRVAIAGRNGAGKSTLFELILGRLTADQGELSIPAGWRIGHMAQESDATRRGALDYVIDGHQQLRAVEKTLESATDSRAAALLAEYQDIGGYEAEARAGEILYGLGFGEGDFDKPFSAFSGGWRIRLNLAQALMAPCDLLLLDEPTNHLDLEAILWLEQWLARFEGTVLVIAHDRAFLDACTAQTLYLSGKSGKLYNGNYSECERQRAEQLEQEQALLAKREAQAAHIQQFIDRFRAKASKARQVQSRIKALERYQVTASVQLESPYSVRFRNPHKASNPLFSFRHLTLGYGHLTVLRDIGQSILPGARIGVLGANGAGKTTLLRALVGDLSPLAGDLMRGQHSETGYFAQHQMESLDLNQRALQILLAAQPDWREQQCRDYLGGWGFDADMITRPVRTLSGGEKARLVLAVIASEAPAILVLDEPTNHLDLDMRDALAMALQDYEGAVIIVSHDRALLDKTVDDFWIVGDGNLQVFSGDLADYSATRSRQQGSSSAPPTHSKKQQRQRRAQAREALENLRRAVRDSEKEMTAAATRLADIEARLADTETYSALPASELDALITAAANYRAELETCEERWLSATEALEANGTPANP